MSLPNVQADFVEAIFSKDGQTDLFEPGKHISIYRNNIYANLVEALANTYSLIEALLGHDFFQMTAKEYIRQYPSRSGNLHDYGEYFGDFLAEYQPVHDLIYLAEVAEFEWACHTVYLSADHPPFVAQALENFTAEQHERLRFILHPASWLRKFHFPILKIVDLCLTNPQEHIDLNLGGVNLLIIRRELDLSLLALPAEDFLFLQALNNNQTLVEALQAAQQVDPMYKLEQKLPAFIQNKVIVDCYLSDESKDS